MEINLENLYLDIGGYRIKSDVCLFLCRRYGPMFGAGADLCISDECNERPESYSNLPHSYDGPQASTSILMGDYNFTVEDYEVFGLKKESLYERV